MRTLSLITTTLAIWLLALPALAFDLQGHRGARGLAPENTLASFARALAVGVHTLETDHSPFVSAIDATAAIIHGVAVSCWPPGRWASACTS